MKAILILAGNYSACNITKQIWHDACSENNIKLDTLELSNEDGENYAKELRLKSFPALIIDEKVIAVGHPDLQTAKNILNTLPSKNNKF